MTPEELEQLINDGTVTYPAAGWLSLIFFTAAWYLNRRLEGNRWSPWIVLPTGVIASLMLYASTWSTTVCGWVAGALVGLGDMFDAEMPITTIMGLVCILAMIATIVDLWVDSTYNLASVWALILAPIMAHGAGGGVGAFVEGAYSSFTLMAIGFVTKMFGA